MGMGAHMRRWATEAEQFTFVLRNASFHYILPPTISQVTALPPSLLALRPLSFPACRWPDLDLNFLS